MAARDREPNHEMDPLRGGLKHNPFGSLRPKAANEPAATPGADELERARAPAPDASEPVPSKHAKTPPKSAAISSDPAQRVIVRRERKGRGGKAVTLAEGPGLASHDLESLAREAARALGAGARVEDGALVVQGEQVERLIPWLTTRGFTSIARGN